jgi:hypothetical protein
VGVCPQPPHPPTPNPQSPIPNPLIASNDNIILYETNFIYSYRPISKGR